MLQSAGAPDTPSCILSRDEDKGLGELYHGGYKAVMNGTFLKKEGITNALMQQSTEAPDTPSCILSRDKNKGQGGLYHGGYKAVMNGTFLKKEGITHVLNTAAD